LSGVPETIRVAGPGADPDAGRDALERTVGSGGVAVFPADGIYGLGCDPLNPDAIARIHSLKGRDDGKPSAVLYFSPLAARELLPSLGEGSRRALGALLPGPVTAVVANPERRYPLACRSDPERLGVRLIEGPLTGATCALFQTSANRSGEPPPAAFEELDPAILAGVDLALDGARLTGEPSTVVDLSALERGGSWQVLREGGMPRSEIAERLARRG
jgi:L-threonylcarbamoyladenylate synthase